MEGITYDKPLCVDDKDRKLLKTLFQDGRMSVANLSKKTGLRRDSVARRLKKLKQGKVITGFVPAINPPALGYPNLAILLLRLKSGVTNKRAFQTQLVSNKFIVHISKLIGKFDFYCAVVYENTNHLNNIIEDIKTYVPNYLTDFEVYQVVNEPKYERMDGLL